MDKDTGIYLEYGQTGNPALFRKLYDEYKVRVLNTMMRIGSLSLPEAEDLLQEVFMKVIQERGRFTPRAKFSTWLYRIATNRAFNAVRDRKPTVAMDESLEDEHAQGALDLLVTGENRELVKKGLERLNERSRAALVLREYEEKSYSEIAEIMECSVEAVESLLFHGRSRLREWLKGRMS